jgi:uncharacterized membrane protein YphA (DoxX/SURF4 family)
MSKRKPMLVLLWLVTGLEVLTMGLAGATKFTNAAMWQGHFSSWGYPVWLPSVVGVAELVGVVFLLVPRTALAAAGGLIVIMLGALGTVLVFQSELGWFGPTLHLVLLSTIVWLRLRLGRPTRA